MDPASLRIKFSPIIKEIPSPNSKCCVEIIPEVSDVRNMERIKWKIEENMIEYTVPMTYKIFIRKNELADDCEGELGRTYHSCVELMQNHSLCDLDLASGDVMRILSDNVIRNKYSSMEDLETIMNDVFNPGHIKSCRSNISNNIKCIDNVSKKVMSSENLFNLTKFDTHVSDDILNSYEHAVYPITTAQRTNTGSPIQIIPRSRFSQFRHNLSSILNMNTNVNLSKDIMEGDINTTNNTSATCEANNTIVDEFVGTSSRNYSNINVTDSKTGAQHQATLDIETSVLSIHQYNHACSFSSPKQEAGFDPCLCLDNDFIPVTPKRSMENIQQSATYKEEIKDFCDLYEECFIDNCYHDVYNNNSNPIEGSILNIQDGDIYKKYLDDDYENDTVIENCFNDNLKVVVDHKKSKESIPKSSIYTEELKNSIQKCGKVNCYRDIYNNDLQSTADHPKSSTENIRDGDIYKKDLQKFYKTVALRENSKNNDVDNKKTASLSGEANKCTENILNESDDLFKDFEDNCSRIFNNLTSFSKEPNSPTENIREYTHKKELTKLYESTSLPKILEDSCEQSIDQLIANPNRSTRCMRKSGDYIEVHDNLHRANNFQESFQDNCYHDVKKNKCHVLVVLLNKELVKVDSKVVLEKNTNTATHQSPINKISDGTINKIRDDTINKKNTGIDNKPNVKVKFSKDIMCNKLVANELSTPAQDCSGRNCLIICDKITSDKAPNNVSHYTANISEHFEEYNDGYEKAMGDRIPPEIRIANFVSKFETDFFPLKMILNDICDKCESMGILRSNNVTKKSSGSLFNCHRDIYKCSSSNSNKSNRVVYTMSFKE